MPYPGSAMLHGVGATLVLAGLVELATMEESFLRLALVVEDFFRSAFTTALDLSTLYGTACLSTLGPTLLVHAVNATKTSTNREM